MGREMTETTLQSFPLAFGVDFKEHEFLQIVPFAQQQ